jgi:hypothetical protein
MISPIKRREILEKEVSEFWAVTRNELTNSRTMEFNFLIIKYFSLKDA